MLSLSMLVVAACAGLAAIGPGPPEVALIIDDIGYSYENGRAAIELPQSFAYAVLPFSPHARSLAELANTRGKDIMVHLPMEADHDNHLLGPGALRLGMSRVELEDTLRGSLAAVPHAIGINNHMGSRLTRTPSHMNWLMHAIHKRGDLFFIDSRTTSHSVAWHSALTAEVASTKRDVFLDNNKSRQHILEQLRVLVAQAKKSGHALGIAHPHPITIEVLREWQPGDYGVRVVGVGDYVDTHRADGAAASIPAPLRLAASECGNERHDTNATEYPDTQR